MTSITRSLTIASALSRRMLIRHKLLGCNQILRKFSTAEQTDIAEIKLNEVLSNVEPRIERRKPAIKPFVKELFYGELDKELLAFPEILNKKEIEAMADNLKLIDQFTSKENVTSDDFLQYLKNIKMYGAAATVFQRGLAANMTEKCRYLEAIAGDLETAVNVKDHWIGIDTLNRGLDSDYADKIIPEFALGKSTINILCFEKPNTSPNLPDINCFAKPSLKGDYFITGEKLFHKKLSDGHFIVFCNVPNEDIQAFLVYPGASGVKFTDNSVIFKETPGTILGRKASDFSVEAIQKASSMVTDILAQNRILTAAICTGILRKAIPSFINHFKNKYDGETPYLELPILQNPISQAVSTLYAAESMIYFTAGFEDGFENPKTEVEMSLCKLYATKRTFEAICNFNSVIGLTESPSDIQKYMDAAKFLYMTYNDNNRLHSYISLLGVQHVGLSIHDQIRQQRNPFAFPMIAIKKLINDRHQASDRPKLTLFIKENLHPSLQETADRLEYCIMRMKYTTDSLLFRHGSEVMKEDRSLFRLTEIVTHVYASIASISRASRAYCIGLYMGQNEIAISTQIVLETENLVRQLVNDIDSGVFLNNDHFRIDIAEKTIKNGSSHYEHCLERVYF